MKGVFFKMYVAIYADSFSINTSLIPNNISSIFSSSVSLSFSVIMSIFLTALSIFSSLTFQVAILTIPFCLSVKYFPDLFFLA